MAARPPVMECSSASEHHDSIADINQSLGQPKLDKQNQSGNF